MYLDLDDAVAGHPQAQEELAELRRRIEIYKRWSVAIARDPELAEKVRQAVRTLRAEQYRSSARCRQSNEVVRSNVLSFRGRLA
jgi:hypothetical protein